MNSRNAESRALAYLYVAYNVGNLAGESAAPQLRQSLGIPDALSAICAAAVAGMVCFLFGSPLYKHANLFGDGDEEIAANVQDASAIVGSSRQHVLEAKKSIPFALLAALILPLPIFYTILYQQNTTMVKQANQLDRHVFNTAYQVPPDLMASLEDWFLLFLIPLLDAVIYERIMFLCAPRSQSNPEHERLLIDDPVFLFIFGGGGGGGALQKKYSMCWFKTKIG